MNEPNAQQIALKIEHLYKRYDAKSRYVVDDVSFSCYRGQKVGLLGVNGAGKTTTLKCLTGMIPYDKGSVEIFGYDIAKQPIKAKRNFSLVTDNHDVFVKMTGYQYVNFMADVYGVDAQLRKTRLQELEQVFRLGDAMDSMIDGYSHGMKQKICMMGSLIHQPDLWILDEPMIGLDPYMQTSVAEYMNQYVASGKTILFSSHNLDMVAKLCDRVVILKKGKVVADIVVDEAIQSDPTVLSQYYI
ncbi:MAG: ABC transporter ATP-binding protein [Christensenellales bacterium]